VGIQVVFHPSGYPGSVREALCEGLRTRRIPARFLYESVAQASRWTTYAKAYAPLHHQEDIARLYDDLFSAALDVMQGKPFQYLGLGCGDGIKDARFLDLAAQGQRDLRVTLVDASPPLVLEATLNLHKYAAKPLVADLEACPGRPELTMDDSMEPIMMTCLGMLPTLGHKQLLPYLHLLTRQKDKVILSANLSPSDTQATRAEILLQYDNEPACAWYGGFLVDLGFTRSDFELKARTESIESIPGAYRIVVEACLKTDVCVTVHGNKHTLHKDASIDLFRSERFTAEALLKCFSDHGFDVEAGSVSGDGQEGLYLLAPFRKKSL
jgi:hypothetical protein